MYVTLGIALNERYRMLKPDGVVVFLVIDPRPRAMLARRPSQDSPDKHKSSPQTNWTDNIEDRFRDLFDEELATTVPCWSKRVAERLKATLRHQDGVAAVNLKSWLEGAG
jgi:SAM-dependent methyltransferase